MLKKLSLFSLILCASVSQAAGVEICADNEKNLAQFVLPGTWQVDYELSRMLFPEIEIPSANHDNSLEKIRLIRDHSDKTRDIFKSMPGCAYLVGRVEFPLTSSNDEALKEVYFAVSVENGNLIIAFSDNDQGYRSKKISIAIGTSRTSDKLFLLMHSGMYVFNRVVS